MLLDQHYPLRYAETRAELERIAASFTGCQIVDPGKNLGLHIGLNYALEQAHAAEPIEDSDLVVGYDPDENPLQAGWLEAMRDVFAAEPKCGWLSLTSKPARDYMLKAGYQKLNLGGREVWRPHYALINHVCGWPMGAIRKVGAFTEPHAFYGGIEVAMQPRYAEHGYFHAYLAEFEDSSFHHLIDPEYAKWKQAHVHGNFAGDFKTFLELRLA